MMFALRRTIRFKFSLKLNIHTNSVRSDKQKNSEPIESKPNLNKKKSMKRNDQNLSNSASKKKLTAELNAKDYANYKSQKSSKIELYSDKSSQEEKLEAKRNLKALNEEIKNEIDANTPSNENLKTIAFTKPKRKVTQGSKNNLVESAKAVAAELGGDAKTTERDILGYLKTLELKTEKRKLNQNVVDVNMETEPHEGKHLEEKRQGFVKYERTRSENPQQQDTKHSFSVRQGSQQFWKNKGQKSNRGFQNEQRITDVILNKWPSGFQPLGIFKASDLKDDGAKLKTWEELEELELIVATTVPPRNYFEELIQWTKEGKLWHFPIDNDMAYESEADIDFTEHVFLENHLEPWCPKRGPLRHFMELVLTGLSKNYHLSVEEKKKHIYWYRDYFESKKKLLQDMGALDNVKLVQDSTKSNSEPENPT